VIAQRLNSVVDLIDPTGMVVHAINLMVWSLWTWYDNLLVGILLSIERN
jgi:hypothetical protein